MYVTYIIREEMYTWTFWGNIDLQSYYMFQVKENNGCKMSGLPILCNNLTIKIDWTLELLRNGNNL